MNNKYRIDDSFVEHGCCWDSAIVRDCEMGKGQYCKDVELVLECNSEMAEEICNALNNNSDYETFKATRTLR